MASMVPMNPIPRTRRQALALTSGGTAAITAVAASLSERLCAEDRAAGGASKGRVRHSVCKWCYPKVSLEDLCVAGKEIGLASIDLLQPEDFPVLAKHGLTCAMVSNPTAEFQGKRIGGIPDAWNRPEHHDVLVEAYRAQIDACAAAGMTNLICFSGNRAGMDDEVGRKNCATGLKRILGHAEAKGVTLSMELLNSKVNHPDYMCDHSAWGVALCEEIGSERFKLLYDIYHMQIMEGDVISTIRAHHAHFSHYHTGGVPGRHEIDETQELHYPAIIRAVVETGYTGFVAQEFIPARPDPLGSLRQAVGICDV
jgi:hydroxypyruvate isomerase